MPTPSRRALALALLALATTVGAVGASSLASAAASSAKRKATASPATRAKATTRVSIAATGTPVVAIKSPAAGATVRGGVTVTATATDRDGIRQVVFRADGRLIATDKRAPYSVTWNSASVADGAHRLTAEATDRTGARATVGIAVTVANVPAPPPPPAPVLADTTPPAVPSSLAVTAAGTGSLTLGWSASSDDVGVAGYEVWLAGGLLGTTTSTGWAAGGLACGTTYRVGVGAFDAAGNHSAQATLDATTAACPLPVDSSPPSLAISGIAAGQTLTQTTTETATASDASGVARVEFRVDGVLKVTDVSAPYSVTVNPADWSAGSHVLTVTAVDTVGNATQAQVSFQIAAPPAPSAFPDASNTGVPAGTVLVPSGSITVTTPGTVIDARDVSGTIAINANDVVVRRTRVTGSAFSLIRVKSGVTGVRIEDVEINGRGLSGTENSMGVMGPATVLRANVYGVENGVTPESGSVLRDSYIHNLGAPGAPHYDGVQIDGGVGQVLLDHNTVDLHELDQTSAVMIDNYFGPITGITVQNNRLRGGGYTVYSDGRFTGGSITGVSFTGNRLGRGYWGYAVIANNSVGWSGNLDDATGAVVNP